MRCTPVKAPEQVNRLAAKQQALKVWRRAHRTDV
jgi:hypothetical protein